MNVLLLGSGGREHALAWKLRQSPLLTNLFIAHGNAGTAAFGTNVAIQATDFQSLKDLVLKERITLVIVGPEEPLVRGVADFFKKDTDLAHVGVVGPSAAGAQLEGSKAFAKRFMAKCNIPTAAYREITTLTEGAEFLKTLQPPYVLKADGLAAGKGVVILNDFDETVAELQTMLDGKFGDASRRVVIETFLSGVEFSVFVLTDGISYKILPSAKDYKRIGEGDTGLNTGGMGAISPVPFLTDELMQKVEEKIIRPTISGLHTEGLDYVGFVFFGLINVGGEPFVIEYNCRLGDPETEAILPRLDNDLHDVFQKLTSGKLLEVEIQQSKYAAATVVLTACGYPNDYRKGDVIELPNVSEGENTEGSFIFHSGTKIVDNQLITNGGRVLAVTSLDENPLEALRLSNETAAAIEFEGKYFRRDIGLDILGQNQVTG